MKIVLGIIVFLILCIGGILTFVFMRLWGEVVRVTRHKF